MAGDVRREQWADVRPDEAWCDAQRREQRNGGSQDMSKMKFRGEDQKAYSDSTDVELLELSEPRRGRLGGAPV